MDPVHREVARFLLAHGVRRDARVLVAVSGGADSVALLHALLALGQRAGVAHVHHGLRGAEADGDLAFVAALARALGVAFHGARVAAAVRDGSSPEARARALRYAELERFRSACGYAHLATAHQLEDQAETVLLRAMRGTGIGGLAAIRPSLDEGRVLRPLLSVRRAELRAYLAARGVPFREDASNADRAIPRNRLRAEVMPALESIHPGATARLAALARLAAEADSILQADLDGALACAVVEGDGGVWLEVEPLAQLDGARRRQALLGSARRAGLAELSLGHVERIEAFLLHAAPGTVLSLPRRFVVLRDRSRLWLGREPGPRFPVPVRVPVPRDGALEFPERGLRLSWHACFAPDPPSRLLRFPARPPEALIARSPAPTDLVFTRGRERRLKELFASARWSREAQARALVVERDGEVVWVPGLFRGEVRASSGSLELRAVRLPAARLPTPL